MSVRRSTLSVIAALCASVGTLAVTATAQAAPDAPAITSVAVNGSPLTGDGDGSLYTNDPIDSGTGQTTDSFTVTVHGDPAASSVDLSGPASLSQTPDANGDTTFAVGSLHPGQDAISVTQTVAGLTSDPTIDSVTVGNVPSISPPQDDVLQTDGNLQVFSAIPGDPVTLSGAGPDISVNADSSGEADFPAADFTADYHNLTAYTVDGQGSASDLYGPASFYVAPPAPTFQTPVSNPLDIAFNNQSEPPMTVSGVLAGATVSLYQLDNGEPGPPLDSVTSANGGTVALQPTTPVADGSVGFVVTQTVSEGTGASQAFIVSDDSAQNALLGLVIDTAAPTLQTSFMGAITNNNEPGFLYSLDGVYSDNAKVRLVNASTGQTLGEGLLRDGEWVPSSPLPDGQYSVYAVSIDDAGNVSAAQSAPVDFTIDTVAPPAPTVTSPADGQTVTTARPAITTAGNEPGATICAAIEAGDGDMTVPCQTADSNGNASFTLRDPLADGAYGLLVSAHDAAGNYSDTETSFTVNTDAATLPGTSPAPPLGTTPAPPTGSSPPVAVAVTTATSKTGVISLNAGKSTAPAGTTITSYAWYLGPKLIGHTKTLDYRLTPADARKTVTLRITDSAGGTSTVQVKLAGHVHTTSVALSAKTLFAFDSARLTRAAKRLLTKLRAVILASPHVTIDGYTASAGPQAAPQEKWTKQLSTERARAVSTFLFGGHPPAGLELSVKGLGPARDSAGAKQDRRATLTYQGFTVTINK